MMLILLTSFLPDKDVFTIKKTFQMMDVDNSGSIEIEELKKGYDILKQKEWESN